MNSYELSTNWFEFSFQNPDKIKPLHTALYFYTIEKCNKMGWKQKFGIPTDQAMEAIGVKNYKTYIKGLLDLVDFGFIKIHQRSKNAYTANIIEVVKNTKVTTNAHTKAGQMHTPKQVQSTVSINKHINYKTIKLIEDNASLVEDNLETWIKDSKKIEVDENDTCLSFDDFWDMYDLKRGIENCKKKYSKISEEDRKLIKETLPLYVASTAKTKTENNGKMFRKNPHTYLNQKCWNDEIIGATTEPKPKKGDTMNIHEIMRKQAEEEKRLGLW